MSSKPMRTRPTRRLAIVLTSAIAVLAMLAMAVPTTASAAVFAKYDGIDGESTDADHRSWTDVLLVDWGANRPAAPAASGQSRRRGAVVVEDMRLTMEYDKAAVKLLEKCLRGEVIPKLEIEQTATYGGARATYLKYELKNVMVTSIDVNASGADDAGPPVVVLSNNFEEIKVTYTEFDAEGNSKGNVETTWKVEKGEK